MLKLEDVVNAYKKLKSYIYHENFSLSIRVKISEFEDDKIEEKLDSLYHKLLVYQSGQTQIFTKYIEAIRCSILPKKFHHNNITIGNEGVCYTNKNKSKVYYLESVTPFIDCAIELHIITVLWINKIGVNLDSELGPYCFGNRLQRNSDNDFEVKSIKLFKKYYVNYTEWRDQGIKKAKQLHEMGLDAGILSLDLKSYYNSVDFDLNNLKADKDYKWLNNILVDIHKFYLGLLIEHKIVDGSQKCLPIGLVSSGILANYYLKEFDKYILKNVKPAFYGRYVDDIVLVFANPIVDVNEDNLCDSFIEKYLINSENKTHRYFNKETKDLYSINIDNNKIFFQQQKVKLFYFLATEPINLLNEFEKEIRLTSSEFKFEPELDDILKGFEKSSYRVSYKDTINKLRSIDGISADKLGASKHLSKIINLTKTSDNPDDDILNELKKEIKTYFSGQQGLELNSLWEKVFTCYIINNSVDDIITFSKNQIIAIDSIEKGDYPDVNDDIVYQAKRNLFFHLANCYAMASSLNFDSFNKIIAKKLKDVNAENRINQILKFLTLDNIRKKAYAVSRANMFRQNLIYYPLINYCNQVENINFLSKDLTTGITTYEFDPVKVRYSPRFIHYHEISLFHHFKILFDKRFLKQDDENFDKKNLYKKIFDDFVDINRLTLKKNKYKANFPSISDLSNNGENKGLVITVPYGRQPNILRVGLVNVKVNANNSINSMKGHPSLDYKRFDEINHVLNESVYRQKSDLIIFPEISIPYQWLPHLTLFSKKNNVAIICGLEHISDRMKRVHNYVITILPFTNNGYKNAIVDFRLKKDYSPSEIQQIEGWKYVVPKRRMEAEQLRLYTWRNVNFSVFNCFELTDIRKRAMFRGLVDFVTTVEYNHDVNYFSNITESISRDIHAYIIQVNTSDYGDSRITQPAETSRKDLLKIKGGENISLITGLININELRKFQAMDHSLQEKSRLFKFTPPNFKSNRKE